MRAFIAVDIPGALEIVPGRTGRGASDHLTLRFLGQIDSLQSHAISEGLSAVAARHSGFRLTLSGIGGFPDLARPRVVYAETSEGREELLRLAADVERAVVLAGVRGEGRPFVPHVTLLRVRSARDSVTARELVTKLRHREIASTTVTELLLKVSELRPDRAVHTVLGRWALRSPDPLAPA